MRRKTNTVFTLKVGQVLLSMNWNHAGNLRNTTGSQEKKPFSYIDAGVA